MRLVSSSPAQLNVHLNTRTKLISCSLSTSGCTQITVTCRIHLTSTQSSSTSRSLWKVWVASRSFLLRGKIYGQYLIDSKRTGKWEVENEKCMTQVHTRSPHADIFSKCFVLSPASYRYLRGPVNAEWQSPLCHLCAWSGAMLRPWLQLSETHRTQGPFLRRCFRILWASNVTGHIK